LYDDVRGALRHIGRHPGPSYLVAAALAVCIGANAAVFSVVRTALLDPYGFPESDSVVNIGMVWEKGPFGSDVQEISPRTYLDIAEAAGSFQATGFVDGSVKVDLGLSDRTERVAAARVTPGTWEVAGIAPRIGRVFEEDDAEAHVVVLSHELWERRFDSDPGVVGSEIRLDGEPHQVIGVMPSGFAVVQNDTQLWLPKVFMDWERSEQARGMHAYQALGRLRDGVSIQRAAHELAALHRALLEQHPELSELAERLGQTYGVVGLAGWVGSRSAGAMVATVQVAALLILMIGSLNVAGVLLARARRRSSELALRRAIGATRRRIFAQLLVETLALYALGAGAGLLIGDIGVTTLPGLLDSGEWLRYGRVPSLDGTVVVVTLAVSLALGLAAGCVPALAATTTGATADLRAARPGSHRTRRWHLFQGIHVAAQLAVCAVLLVGAFAALGNVRALMERGAGVETTDRLVATVALPEYRYGHGVDADPDVRAFARQASSRLGSIPGIEAAAVASRVPLARQHIKVGFGVEGYSTQPGEQPVAIPYGVGPDYLAAVGTPLLRGRGVAATDTEGSQPVVVVSEGIVDRYLQGREPIGATLGCLGRDWTIVGVVADTLDIPLSMADAHSLYFPHTQWSGRQFSNEISFVVRTRRSADAIAESVRQALLETDRDLDVQVAALGRLQRRALVTQRVPAGVTACFAAIAILLSGLGIYGLLALSVKEDTNEIGVRLALGASRASVLALVVRRLVVLSALGLGVGLAAAFLLGRLLDPLLAEVDATAPGIFALAAGILLATETGGACLPAWRATRVDPAAALRAE
jgi:predicted permease